MPEAEKIDQAIVQQFNDALTRTRRDNVASALLVVAHQVAAVEHQLDAVFRALKQANDLTQANLPPGRP